MMGTLLLTTIVILCCVLGYALARQAVNNRRKRAAARKWWLEKIRRMCDAVLDQYDCTVCKKLEDSCYDRDRHIFLEGIRRWRTWAQNDFAEWLLEEGAEKKLARLIARRPPEATAAFVASLGGKDGK